MTSPSQPVNIGSPRLVSGSPFEGVSGSFTTPVGTPDLRALRAQYTAVGTPPPPNIPPRGTPVSAQRTGESPLSSTPLFEGSPLRPGPQVIGGISAARGRPATPSGSGSETPPRIDLDGLTDEEKAKVVRRHLVSKDERLNGPGKTPSIAGSDLEIPQSHLHSRRSSSNTGPTHPPREDTEPFPIPYHAPGADVT